MTHETFLLAPCLCEVSISFFNLHRVNYSYSHMQACSLCLGFRQYVFNSYLVWYGLSICLSKFKVQQSDTGKRPRDLLNPKALKYMQSVFSIKDTIGKKETREISALCKVTVSQVSCFNYFEFEILLPFLSSWLNPII